MRETPLLKHLFLKIILYVSEAVMFEPKVYNLKLKLAC